MTKKLLIVSPHPDDETLGAGGTLLRYKSLGYSINWLNITNILSEYGYDDKIVDSRKKEIQLVKESYEIDHFLNLNLKPANLEMYSSYEMIGKISNFMNEVRPEIVIVPYAGDVHSDHKIVFDWIYSCTKTFRYPFIKKITQMEIISETDYASSDIGFIPNCFVDISDFLDKKIEISKIYNSEFGEHPFPRSTKNIKALAINRGASSGLIYAEAFRILKEII